MYVFGVSFAYRNLGWKHTIVIRLIGVRPSSNQSLRGPRIPIPLRSKDASLRWRLPLPEEVPRGSTFYIDGSDLDADTKVLLPQYFQ